jgi:hypothetical protein
LPEVVELLVVVLDTARAFSMVLSAIVTGPVYRRELVEGFELSVV